MTGYSAFARLIAQHPEYAIFRAFNEEYEEAALQDKGANGRTDFEKSWQALSEAKGADAEQYKTARKFFDKLDEYYQAILQTVQIERLPKPRGSAVRDLHDWLDLEQGSNNFFLKHTEHRPYDPEYPCGLLVVDTEAHSDTFAQLLVDLTVDRWHRLIGRRMKPTANDDLGKRWEYKHSRFVRLADLVCACMSGVIPVAAIFALYFTDTILDRLVVVTVMTFLFSFILAILFRGRRMEVFTATMAFAAVQVVFVGGVNVHKGQ